MKKLWLCISDGSYLYGQHLVRCRRLSRKCTKEYSNDDTKHNQFIHIDSAFLHYLLRELLLSDLYRINFIYYWTVNKNKCLTFFLQTTQYDLIDYNWNERVYQMVRERCELDNALSWLSTLGGAFSALGDYFSNCAHTAGKISVHQLNLALRLGDPNIAARCRLYFGLSLIQQRRYKLAQRIIYKEYQVAKSGNIVDQRLLNMCKGIWAKLQYEHALYRKLGIEKNLR